MIKIICKVCKKEFSVFSYRVKTVKYCSLECRNISKKGISNSPKTQFKKGFTPWNKGKKLPQCSGKNHPLWGKYHSEKTKKKMSDSKKNKYNGSNNPHWKGGKIKQMGYWYILNPTHPRADKNSGYIKNANLIMEKHLGRYLKSKEIVHHIDGNKQNDNLNNLILFPDKSAHTKYHHLLKKSATRYLR